MGGVFGKLHFDRTEQDFHTLLARMSEALAHRGPDATAIYIAPGIALGERGFRGERTHCGVIAANEERTVHAVVDADLTNGRELRRQLERHGHHFQGTSDSEIVAHAFEQWGERCVAELQGPFACAIWDERNGALLLARDRLGIRPLCFAFRHGHAVVFASEIKGVLEDQSVGRGFSPEALDTYLALGYIPAPLTIYRDVSKLEPGHVLIVEGHSLRTRQYWDMAFEPGARLGREETLGALQTTLRDAMSDAGSDDAPAGLLQSGGMASTALLSAVTGTRPVAAMSVAVEQEASSVLRIAAAARHAGATADVDIVTPDVADVAPRLAWHLDEPCGNPAALSHFAVYTAARARMDVAMTGHGAAALWAGYPRHRIERIESSLRAWLGRPLATLGGQLGQALPQSLRGARALSHLVLPPAGACVTKHAYGLFDDEQRRSLYTRSFAWKIREANPFARHLELYAQCPSGDPLSRALYVEARTFLPDSTLAIADRLSAAASLRLRLPYLDHRVVGLAAEVPNRFKQHGAAGMYALRELVARTLPRDLRPPARRRPAQRPWLDAALQTMVPSMLLGYRFDDRGVFSRLAVTQLWEEHRTGRARHNHRLWSLLMLEFWFRKFVDGDAAEEPLEYAVLMKAA